MKETSDQSQVRWISVETLRLFTWIQSLLLTLWPREHQTTKIAHNYVEEFRTVSFKPLSNIHVLGQSKHTITVTTPTLYSLDLL